MNGSSNQDVKCSLLRWINRKSVHIRLYKSWSDWILWSHGRQIYPMLYKSKHRLTWLVIYYLIYNVYCNQKEKEWLLAHKHILFDLVRHNVMHHTSVKICLIFLYSGILQFQHFYVFHLLVYWDMSMICELYSPVLSGCFYQ